MPVSPPNPLTFLRHPRPWRTQTSSPARTMRCATMSPPARPAIDRKSTRLNSSHLGISYAVFCLKKKSDVDSVAGVRNDLGVGVGRQIARDGVEVAVTRDQGHRHILIGAGGRSDVPTRRKPVRH